MDVDRFYSHPIVSVSRSSSLQRAAESMKDHHVGALLVTDDAPDRDRPIGMVTDRDLVLQGVARGMRPTEATIGEVMTRELATVPKTADIHEAMEAMRRAGVRRLGVTEADGTLVGIVSVDDIVDALVAIFAGLSDLLHAGRQREAIRRINAAPFSG